MLPGHNPKYYFKQEQFVQTDLCSTEDIIGAFFLLSGVAEFFQRLDASCSPLGLHCSVPSFVAYMTEALRRLAAVSTWRRRPSDTTDVKWQWYSSLLSIDEAIDGTPVDQPSSPGCESWMILFSLLMCSVRLFGFISAVCARISPLNAGQFSTYLSKHRCGISTRFIVIVVRLTASTGQRTEADYIFGILPGNGSLSGSIVTGQRHRDVSNGCGTVQLLSPS